MRQPNTWLVVRGCAHGVKKRLACMHCTPRGIASNIGMHSFQWRTRTSEARFSALDGSFMVPCVRTHATRARPAQTPTAPAWAPHSANPTSQPAESRGSSGARAYLSTRGLPAHTRTNPLLHRGPQSPCSRRRRRRSSCSPWLAKLNWELVCVHNNELFFRLGYAGTSQHGPPHQQPTQASRLP